MSAERIRIWNNLLTNTASETRVNTMYVAVLAIRALVLMRP